MRLRTEDYPTEGKKLEDPKNSVPTLAFNTALGVPNAGPLSSSESKMSLNCGGLSIQAFFREGIQEFNPFSNIRNLELRT